MREFAFNAEIFSVAQDAVSIDGSRGDPALENARVAFPGHGDHIGNSEAVDSLLQLLRGGQGTCTIVGQGNKGDIVTNESADPRTNNDWIYSGNKRIWHDIVLRLKPQTTFLKLFACNVAAGNSGAVLLSLLANLIDAPVTGPTGLLFPTAAGTIVPESGTQWPVAYPDRPLTPIPAPVNFFTNEFDVTMFMMLNDKPAKLRVPFDTVTGITYFPGRSKSGPGVSLSAEEAISVLSLINLAQPFNPGGPPLAMVTGHLDVTFRDAQGAEATRAFVIYNDNLVWEPLGDAYYNTSPTFETVLASL